MGWLEFAVGIQGASATHVGDSWPGKVGANFSIQQIWDNRPSALNLMPMVLPKILLFSFNLCEIKAGQYHEWKPIGLTLRELGAPFGYDMYQHV